MKVRFVYPRFERFLDAYPDLAEIPPIEGLWKFRMPPSLGLPTLAAATPAGVDWEVTDANDETPDYDEDVDLVAISFFTPQAEHAYEVADRYRARGRAVVMGGMHPTMLPEDAAQHCDALCIGEADTLWPRILDDARRGALRPRYGPDMPVPSCWARPKRNLFERARGYDWKPELVQVARGCPRDCPYCNIPAIQGDALRFRPLDEVADEIRALAGREVYLIDDVVMFKARSVARYTTQLFERLADYDVKTFLTSSLVFNARPRFLDVLARGGTQSIYVTFGFEPISRGIYDGDRRMIDHGKAFVDRVQERGIRFHAAFGVGFDEDGPGVFDRILEFCEEAGIVTSEFFIATPFPNTPMWRQLRSEDRLHHTRWTEYNGAHVVFEPKQMTADELHEGYLRLWKEFYSRVDALRSLSCFVHAKEQGARGTG